MKRETGYYWVKDRTRNCDGSFSNWGWEVLYFENLPDRGVWMDAFDEEKRNESDFLEINETRILNPDERK